MTPTILFFVWVAATFVNGGTPEARTRRPLAPRTSPIIIFPGFQVSSLQYSLNHSNSLPNTPWCKTTTSPTWEQLSPLPDGSSLDDLACYIQNMKMQPDPTSLDTPFVPTRTNMSTRTIDFGSFNGTGGMLSTMVARLVTDGWATDNHSLACAPYDFRVPPFGLKQTLFVSLKNLVEMMYTLNGNTSVTLWGLSGATPYILSFLNAMTAEWKDQFVQLFIADSPVWSGATLSVLAYVSGFIPGLNQSAFGDSISCSLARGMPSIPWLFPRLDNSSIPCNQSAYLWDQNESIVTTPAATYTAANYSLLLRDLGLDTNATLETLRMVTHDTDMVRFQAPGVDTLVIIGNSTPTPTAATYATAFSPASECSGETANITYGDGDGVVPIRSALRSQVWVASQQAQSKQLVHLVYPNLKHATCSFPQSGKIADTCYQDVLSYIRNATRAR